MPTTTIQINCNNNSQNTKLVVTTNGNPINELIRRADVALTAFNAAKAAFLINDTVDSQILVNVTQAAYIAAYNAVKEAKSASLVGRLKGNNINFTIYTYDQLKMKRKTNVLLYKELSTITKKKTYSSLVNNYSNSQLRSSINTQTTNTNCPNNIGSSSASGVIGPNTFYYNDPNVPYYPNL